MSNIIIIIQIAGMIKSLKYSYEKINKKLSTTQVRYFQAVIKKRPLE